jgi:hypothetical protein
MTCSRGTRFRKLLIVFLMLAWTAPSFGQQTIGLFEKTASVEDGYVLFSSLTYPELYLIDNDGQRVHSWPTTFVTANTAYLLEDGSVMRGVDAGGTTVFVAGGDGGVVQHLDWDGTVLWEYVYQTEFDYRHHHDIAVLPNGNVLLIAWEGKSLAEAIAAGRDPTTLLPGTVPLWPEHIVEVEPVGTNSGNIVWEWHLWDHLIQDFDGTKANFGVVADHSELVDVNFRRNESPDWIHMNSIDYNADLDQIVVSSPFLNEFWILDHSTTTAEAASHTGGDRGMGGDILYRWGNPQSYGAGTTTDQQLFNQHDVSWIPPGLLGAGNILLFNNGRFRTPVEFSSIEEIVTTVDVNGDYPQPGSGTPHGPIAPIWHYEDPVPTDLYSSGLSGAQRLPNGNTLSLDGRAGRLFEIDDLGDRHWLYVNPVGNTGPVVQFQTPVGNITFRATRYLPSYLGFVGRDLSPKGTIELRPVPGLASTMKVGLALTLGVVGFFAARRASLA